MRTRHAGPLVTACTTLLLAACTDGVSAPRAVTTPLTATLSACNTWAAQRAQPMGDGQILSGVTVTATFPGAAGLPWNVMQQMQFPLNYGAEQAPCLNTQAATFVVDTLYITPLDPVPLPAGVDAEWWDSLSPREQHAIVKRAEEFLRIYPNRYSGVPAAIAGFFEPKIRQQKLAARIRANDFQLGPNEGELLAGGIYGCMLYKQLTQSVDWFLPNDETLAFVLDLLTAFAEAEFRYAPLRAVRFASNGAIGAGMAATDVTNAECGRLIFESIPTRRINVEDPYAVPAVPPQTGYPPSRPVDPVGTLPPGWYDQ